MEQTPVHEQHNRDLLAMLPTTARRIVEVGCSSGALAREYKKLNPGCQYAGIEIVPEYAHLAKRYCDSVHAVDIEGAPGEFIRELAADCWIFGDCLEHLRDPWALLARIRECIPDDGSIVACIPNAQHWTVQVRLCCGEFRYEDMGLMDRTHLRWFTRMTILEMFQNAKFKVVAGVPRIFNEPNRERILPAIEMMAKTLGADAKQAVADAIPFQYVVRAVPA